MPKMAAKSWTTVPFSIVIGDKPDNQREDGQGIHVARLVCDKTPDSLNKHAAGFLNSA
jgi:hypothetical protein